MARRPTLPRRGPITVNGVEYTRSTFRRLPRDEKRQLIIDWFFEHYEDPAVRLPHESREGGYQWIWGGPYNADEEVREEFEDVAPEAVLTPALDEIQAQGFDWSPVPRDSDYEQLEDDLFDPRIRPGLGAPYEEDEQQSDAQFRATMLERLDALEALIRDSGRGMVGHNRPPGPIDDLPLNAADSGDLIGAIGALRAEAEKPSPDLSVIDQSTGTLRRRFDAIAAWVTERANAQIDNAVSTTLSGTFAASLVVYGKELLHHLGQTIEAITTWVGSLPMF